MGRIIWFVVFLIVAALKNAKHRIITALRKRHSEHCAKVNIDFTSAS
jgi:hypothetical protein